MDSKKILKKLLVSFFIIAAGFLPFVVQYAMTGSDKANDFNICALLIGLMGGILYPFAGIQGTASMALLVLVMFTVDNVILRILVYIALFFGMKFLYLWLLRIRSRCMILRNNPEMTKKEADQIMDEMDKILSDPQKTREAYEETCLAEGYFHVSRPDGEVLKVMAKAGQLYFCRSGNLDGNPFEQDDCREPLEEQLSKHEGSFRLLISEISEVLIQEQKESYKSGRKKLKIIFKTPERAYEFFDLGFVDQDQVKRLLKENSLLHRKGRSGK